VAHVGLRHDRHRHFAARTTPRLGLVWSAGDATTVKALFGTAFRAPNEYELHYYDTTGALRPERIRTFEVVVERRLAPESRLVATAYSNRIDGLLSLRSDAAGELYFANMEKVRADGAELALEGRLRRVHGRLSYSYQDARQAEGPWLDNSARHLAKLALRTPLLRGRLWAALDTSVSSARRTLAGGRAGAFLLSNLTLNAPELLGPIDVSATVYNAFDARYGDPGSEEHRQDLIPQDGRSFRVRASWRF
jgi:iron complex outermembrane receptor protein